jgi:peptidoglycan/LPS O-acetylase OafA/YrhL
MRYNPAFDGIRAFSVLAVVMFHCGAPGAAGGFIGVDVFFVLSGYLITSLLADEHRAGGIEAARFYARRALRLYPTLLLMVAVYLGLAPILWPADDRWLSAALASLYAYDYALAFWKLTYTIGHTWSLGVEEKFYLLWPLVLPALLRTRHPVRWLAALTLAVTAWRYFVAVHWTWQQAYFRFDTRMSGILLGAIAALKPIRMPKFLLAPACLAFALLVVLPSLPATHQIQAVTLRITVAELAAFVLVCHAARTPRMAFLASRPMAYIGRLSYGIYLWHFPVVLLVRDSQPVWIRVCAALAFAITMAAICRHCIDEPLRRWRRRTWAAPRGAA